jgi:hypothetical protein
LTLAEPLALLYDAPIERVPCRELLITARRFGTAMSGYDALYAALAGRARRSTAQSYPELQQLRVSGRYGIALGSYQDIAGAAAETFVLDGTNTRD